MNPPSALHGAMGRERKPFTYTPGGLDLSEIKSERMARRLMRNAMNQGVPEVSSQPMSPPMPSTPIAVPNFNCLPVQVFPSFQLPANPKSLLRTRSTPTQPREPVPEIIAPSSPYVYDVQPNSSDRYQYTNSNNVNNNDLSFNNMYGQNVATSFASPQYYDNLGFDFSIQPLKEDEFCPRMSEEQQNNETNLEDDQKVVKKVKKEKKVEESQNGEATEAEVTVKIAPKKAAVKTETTVEVVKKVGSDGQVEEIKTTTTKTITNGKTEISTKTETRKLPAEKPQEEEVEEEEEEEEELVVEEPEEEIEEEVIEEPKQVSKTTKTKTVIKEAPVVKENGHQDVVIKKEEKSQSSTTKKVVVVEKEESEEEEEEEQVEEVKQEIVKENKVEKPVQKQNTQKKVEEPEEIEEEEEEEEEEVVEVKEQKLKEVAKPEEVTQVIKEQKKVEMEEEEEEDEEEEVEATIVVKKPVKKESTPPKEIQTQPADEESEEEEEDEEEVEVKQIKSQPAAQPKKEEDIVDNDVKKDQPKEESEEEEEKEEVSEKVEAPTKSETKVINEEKVEEVKVKPKEEVRDSQSYTIPVESIEIKPIPPAGETISRSHTESTEITFNEGSVRPVSTQTELERIENVVTVNRTTKCLDQAYEQITQHGVPTVKTYFAPTRDRVSISPSRPYQPGYPSETQPERRHSLLLDRLSTERQMPPTESYQNNYQSYNNQSYEAQNQWQQEPQSEIVNASNVKPSSITNQQWYQQNQKDNVIYNNVKPSPPSNQQWSQPSYTENVTQDYSKTSSNIYQQSYPSNTQKPSTWSSNNLGQIDTLPSINSQSNQYSYMSKDSTESYQKSTQQYSTTYVPPPWETDSTYVPENTGQTYYQAPQTTNTFNPNLTTGWTPTPQPKYSKPVSNSYQPPAPNQSFVKNVNIMEPPKIPGRKTYYSEYERRYISVPESTYIPSETKYQPQPDPSPQYYYDNNEPTEQVEHTWRKELREFTEKSQTQQQTEEISAQPPWETEPTYGKTPTVTYTPTPSWSQTLRPRSCRERSFESEYLGSQDWKTNTVGRGRPVSSYVKSNIDSPIPERPRGVSVDRYNPHIYQSPVHAEHPPVPVQTLSPIPPAKSHHNPHVPAYHARASAEPREHVVSQQQTRVWGEPAARASPIQSRSFKYLQWITGTEE